MYFDKKSILFSLLLICFLSSCVQSTGYEPISAENVYLSIINSSLEAEAPSIFQDKELGEKGINCRCAQFFMPSLGDNIAGNIFECTNIDMRNKLVIHLIEKDNYRSWVIVKGIVLMKIAGEVQNQLVQRYADAIPGSGSPSILPPNSNIIENIPDNIEPSAIMIPTNPIEPPPTVTLKILPTITNTPYISPTSECDPSYPDVCLKKGIGDFDCLGGTGNGPNYVQGPIRVLPPDPFELDDDQNGWGCN